MTKAEFILELTGKLPLIPWENLEEHVNFYLEMIDDRIEEGYSEEEAVAAAGSIDDIAAQIITEIPFTTIVKEKIKPKRKMSAWEIILIILGSPLWIALLAAAFAVVISIYAVLWTVVVSLWAVFVSLAASGVACAAGGAVLCFLENPVSGLPIIGAALVCAGLAIFMFFGCKAATKGCAKLTKLIALGIKKSFARKEKA